MFEYFHFLKLYTALAWRPGKDIRCRDWNGFMVVQGSGQNMRVFLASSGEYFFIYYCCYDLMPHWCRRVQVDVRCIPEHLKGVEKNPLQERANQSRAG